MIDLSDCTLVCADTRNHALALRALNISRGACRFARTLFFTDREIAAEGIQVVPIAPLASAADYSRLLVKELSAHISTAFVLVVQWDGYVLHPEVWDERFRDFDYIGARWPWLPPGNDIGNGGFSLRSRKLLDALADPEISDIGVEDVAIGQTYRGLLESRYGLRFPPAELADRFSFETLPLPAKTFGFHALYNFWRTLPDAELPIVLAALADANTATPQLRVLGANYLSVGKHAQAILVFERILQARPGEAEVSRLLKLAQRRQSTPLAGRNDPCPCGSGRRYKACHGALGAGLAPASQDAPTQRGETEVQQALRLHERGDVAAARAIYQRVLAQSPDDPVATHFLGVAAMQQKDLDTALPLLAKAVRLAPEEPNFHNNLGLALADAGRIEEALPCYERSLAIDSRNAGAWSNLGLARQEVLDLPGAIAAFRSAIALAPDLGRAHWNLAMALLLDGQFSEGWREYEWRTRIDELGGKLPPAAGRRWQGEDAPGATLLVHAEQGYGDCIQFARYVPLLKARGFEVVLECQPALLTLLATLPGNPQLLAAGSARPGCDLQIPLPSLPGLLGLPPAVAPAREAYLHADAPRAARWDDWLGPRRGRRIGLVWAGNPAHRNDRNRSLPLALLAPLLALPQTEWISLQMGAARDQLEGIAPEHRPRDASAGLLDFADTAGLIAKLDLVIAVDTSVAHLAGALAKP
ncbi:MAG: tetratricopeptide repeat protein, partial [Burkholderiales bacterium]